MFDELEKHDTDNIEFLDSEFSNYTELEITIESSGNTYHVFLPKNVSEGTTINGTIYYPGLSGYSNNMEGRTLRELYSNHNIDTAFIAASFASNNNKNVSCMPDDISEIVDQINKDTSILINLNDYSAFSGGGKDIIEQFLFNLKNNDNNDRLSLTLYDVYGYSIGDKITFTPKISDEEFDLMQDNDTQITFFTTKTRTDTVALENSNNLMDRMVENGLRPVIIYSENLVHNSIMSQTVTDGWKLYLDGKIDISEINNAQNYYIKIPIKNDDNKIIWKSYALKEIVAFKNNPTNINDELNVALDYLNSIVINKSILELANGLKEKIKILTNLELFSLKYSSSSLLLPREVNVMNDYINSIKIVGKLLESDIIAMANLKSEYDKIDSKLQEELSNLENGEENEI